MNSTKSKLYHSPACTDLVIEFEGLHRVKSDGLVYAYKCPSGVVTVGYGSTRDPINDAPVLETTVISKNMARVWLDRELQEISSDINNLLSGVPVNQNMFDAIVSFAYNVGLGALGRSTLLKRLRAADYIGAACEFSRWVKGADGEPLPGLVHRREREKGLFCKVFTLEQLEA